MQLRKLWVRSDVTLQLCCLLLPCALYGVQVCKMIHGSPNPSEFYIWRVEDDFRFYFTFIIDHYDVTYISFIVNVLYFSMIYLIIFSPFLLEKVHSKVVFCTNHSFSLQISALVYRVFHDFRAWLREVISWVFVIKKVHMSVSDFGRLWSYDRLKLRIEGNDYQQ